MVLSRVVGVFCKRSDPKSDLGIPLVVAPTAKGPFGHTPQHHTFLPGQYFVLREQNLVSMVECLGIHEARDTIGMARRVRWWCWWWQRTTNLIHRVSRFGIYFYGGYSQDIFLHEGGGRRGGGGRPSPNTTYRERRQLQQGRLQGQERIVRMILNR